ncbi:MAG: hypothetical protein ACR2P4_03870 [Gammaproteobacteria bacterium]
MIIIDYRASDNLTHWHKVPMPRPPMWAHLFGIPAQSAGIKKPYKDSGIFRYNRGKTGGI